MSNENGQLSAGVGTSTNPKVDQPGQPFDAIDPSKLEEVPLDKVPQNEVLGDKEPEPETKGSNIDNGWMTTFPEHKNPTKTEVLEDGRIKTTYIDGSTEVG